MDGINTSMTTSTAPKPSPFDHFPESVDGRDRYNVGGIKAEDVIVRVMDRVFESCGLMFTAWDVGNALKYLLRLGKKDDVEIELGKAENYLHHARTGRWLD